MSGSRTCALLLRLYPSHWRARYGEELAAVIVEASGGGRVPWRTRLDVARAGGNERLHAAGLGAGARPPERARAGALLVLCAWTAFVFAGGVVQKFSEHWQDATPAASRGLPAAAVDVFLAGAALGSVAVLAGIAATLPGLAAFLSSGGWSTIRRRIVSAAIVSGVAVVATVALASWAHRLDNAQRNGHDLLYATAFLLWVLLFAGCLAAWSSAAVATARRLTLPAPLLRLEAWLAAAATVAMAAMTAATALWWGSLARSAPWFFSGTQAGSSGSPLAAQLCLGAALMLVATLVAAAGTARALRALPALSGPDPG